jgi:predicted acylesterase/phospholipase RssA/CRP-like cAMP-binding protein
MASLDDRLRAVPFFRSLPAGDLAAIAARMQARSVRKGAFLFREGERADAMFFVQSGEVEVLHGFSDRPVAVLGAGSFAGELGLLLGEPRSATLRAAGPTRLWSLSRHDLERLLDDHPAIARELSAELSRRLVTTTRRLVPSGGTRFTAMVSADVGALVDAIAAEGERVGVLPLRRIAATAARVVDPAVLTENGGPAAANPTLVGIDHVVIALPRREDPATRAAVDAAEWVVTSEDLVPWVARRHSPGRHLIVDPRADWRVVARRVMGRAVGLVLSSGGSKTIAHIGALDALDELGVRFDAVAGASGGALVGVGAAAGLSAAAMTGYIRELAELLRPRRWDFHLVPRTGLIKGKRLRDLLDRWFEGRDFSDLRCQLYVVASDVNTGEEVVIDSGSLADAVRASMSIPGAFDPWRYRGRVLIDGGVTDPLPAGCLRDGGYERIIGSNVAGKDVDPSASAGDRLPNIVSVMTRTVNLMEAEVIKAQLPRADVVIRPHVTASSSFDFSRIDDFIAEGRAAAFREAESIERLTISRR